MKKLLSLLCLTISFCMVSKAQDVIITNNDNMLKVYNLEIGKNVVFYQMSLEADATILKMPKSEIFIIKMQDGSKIDPNAQEETISNDNPNDESISFQNQQLIKEWNDVVYKLEEPISEKKSIHNPLFVKLGVKSNSQLCNEDLTLHYKMVVTNEYYNYLQDRITLCKDISIQVTNNTSRMLYVDMSQSFFTGKQKVQPMYSGKTITNTKAGTTGISLGIFGGASANAQTTVITEQKIIPIPPRGTITLPYTILDPLARWGKLVNKENIFVNPITQSSIQMLTDLAAGESKCFEEKDTNVDMYISLAYSDDEQMQNVKIIRTDFYLQQILKLKSWPSGTIGNKYFDMIVPKDFNSVWLITCRYDGAGYIRYEEYSTKP